MEKVIPRAYLGGTGGVKAISNYGPVSLNTHPTWFQVLSKVFRSKVSVVLVINCERCLK